MLALDCEFDGHGGQLISMALVTEDGDFFYEVLPQYMPINVQWVKDNVLTVLHKAPIGSNAEFRIKLHDFLIKHSGHIIHADSPADFIHLMESCHGLDDQGRYVYLGLDITMKFVVMKNHGIDLESLIPHNALEDARALMKGLKLLYAPSSDQVGQKVG